MDLEKFNFVAVDVETANPDRSSICQIGVAKYASGELVDEWSSLVNPEDFFNVMNIAVHGITEADVSDSPKFPEVADQLREAISGTVCVNHNSFDRVAITRALDKYNLPMIDTTWLDSARMARCAWKDVAVRGYSLDNLCKKIGYKFNPHDALEDAKAAAQIVLSAANVTGLDIDGWLVRVKQPIDLEKSYATKKYSVKCDGNPEGELFGEVVVFTGALAISRQEAADLAQSVGCSVATTPAKKTTMLVLGTQDMKKLAGKEKSRKHISAEKLIEQGQSIQILSEDDFNTLIEHASS